MNVTCGWDWYQGTITGLKNPDEVVARLVMDAAGLTLRASSGGYNRPESVRGDFAGGSIAIYFGNDLDVHVLGSSSAAVHVAAVLRAHWPEHTVSRVDACMDFDAPGAFERLYPELHALARTPRRGGRGGVVATSTVGDWLDNVDGRTLYVGGPQSQYRVRCYEKGHEQRSKHPDQTFSLDWARVEAQVRPHGSGKRVAATATPAEVFAWTPFGSAVLQAIAGLELVPLAPARVPSTDPEFWLARQYGPILRDWLVLDDFALRARLIRVLELQPVSL